MRGTPARARTAVLITRPEAGVAVLRLDGEHNGNAISRATADDLDRALDELVADPGLTCLVVTGTGSRFFCTGGDLDDYSALDTQEAGAWMAQRMGAVLDRLLGLPALVVAAVDGVALGGGLELALACDVRVAGAQARFSLPQVRLGVVPGWGGVARLTALVGRGRALAVMATARQLPADEALALHLVDEVVPAGEAERRALELAREVAVGSVRAVRSLKTVADRPDGVVAVFGELWDAEDHRAAERARAERQAARATGR
jgi:enoyl-CoA hydratase/carnithine racemase